MAGLGIACRRPAVPLATPQQSKRGAFCGRFQSFGGLGLSAFALGQCLGRPEGRRARCRARKNERLPSCVVFDLDGCLWSPEMYELSWERGGSPFSYDASGLMRDRKGCIVSLYSGVESALTELATEKRWKGVTVAVASCCDVPRWAFELLGKFEFGPKGSKLNDVISISKIYKGNKQGHLREIRDTVGCGFEEMIFFDNEPYNCMQVAGLSPELSITLASFVCMSCEVSPVCTAQRGLRPARGPEGSRRVRCTLLDCSDIPVAGILLLQGGPDPAFHVETLHFSCYAKCRRGLPATWEDDSLLTGNG